MALNIYEENVPFADRVQAGRLLAERVIGRVGFEPLVLAVPRGGVTVGFHLAQRLGADFDIVIAHKLGAPGNPELAVGAVMENGETYVNHALVAHLGIDAGYLRHETEQQLAAIARRLARYRAVRPFVPRKGRNLIVVDDGVATGATMITALRGLRASGPSSLACALPVGPLDTLEALEQIADDVFCLRSPSWFEAVGAFYVRFDQVPDETVLDLLRRARETKRNEGI